MILPFSTQINRKPTYFVERIHAGIVWNQATGKISKGIEGQNWKQYTKDDFDLNAFATKHMKIHTIREDKNDRWKEGTNIDFFINCRQPSMFRFAPVLPVISTQKIEIYWISDVRSVEISKLNPKRLNFVDVIVDHVLLELNDIKLLSQNDGFDNVEEFFDYFNKDFTGKLIHWTDIRY